MKQLKSGVYKASNFSFDPNTISARSYSWWEFVKVLKGKVIFNAYKYSVTTAKHQRNARRLLEDHGIRIDLEVTVRESLSGFSSLAELKKRSLDTEISLAQARRQVLFERRIRANEKARARRLAKKQAALGSTESNVIEFKAAK